MNARKLKIILLGDAASGKSKLMERFLLDDYRPERLSTQAVNIFHYRTSGTSIKVNDKRYNQFLMKLGTSNFGIRLDRRRTSVFIRPIISTHKRRSWSLM